MREYQIGEKEAGQTLLKFLQKYLPLAPSSFFSTKCFVKRISNIISRRPKEKKS